MSNYVTVPWQSFVPPRPLCIPEAFDACTSLLECPCVKTHARTHEQLFYETSLCQHKIDELKQRRHEICG